MDGLLEALRSMTLEDLQELSNVARGGRARTRVTKVTAKRRASKDGSGLTDKIVLLLKQNKRGLRAEDIRAKLGVSRAEVARSLAGAMGEHRVTKKGRKRATTYFAK